MNTSTLQTVSGISLAVIASVINFIVNNPVQGQGSATIFWLGVVGAGIYGWKSFYAQGTAPAGQVIPTVPTGTEIQPSATVMTGITPKL